MHRYAPTPRQMLWGILGAFVLMVLFVAIGYAVTSIPSPNSVATRQSTLLMYSDGKHILARLGDTNRTNVTLAQVPLDVQHAVLSAEDRNFETESGISPTGIMRAMWVDLTGGEVQGGSTITQQYVKNAYLTQARTFTRKFKEIFIAAKLGNTRPKNEILTDNGFDDARQAAGGYRVITTIDFQAQDAAVKAVRAHDGDYRATGVDKGRESALVTVQPGDGAIRAMYGGGDGCQNPSRKDACTDLTGVDGLYNRAGDFTRSPGSSFKPYTLIAALQDGISLDSRFPGPSHIAFP